MTERPITFPKTEAGEWVNSETGVQIVKRHPTVGGYKVLLPTISGRTSGGSKKTLSAARNLAGGWVGEVRSEIAEAYVEAVAEHAARVAREPGTTERAITFPKTGDGEWTNSETGVKVTRYGKGYRAFRPADTSTGYIGICAEVRTLAQAKDEAAYYVRNVARPAIAKACAEALRMDAERIVEQDGADALVHFWTLGPGNDHSACGVNIMTTPYTFGSPEWPEVTCPPCKATRPAEVAPQFAKGDVVVFVDVDGTGIDTDAVWRIESVRDIDTERPYAELAGHTYPAMRSASYFTRLTPAPRCGAAPYLGAHEFVEGGSSELARCDKLRTDDVHNTDQARAAATIHAARDHEGVPAGKPYGGEWPGTTDVRLNTFDPTRRTGGGKGEAAAREIAAGLANGKAVTVIESWAAKPLAKLADGSVPTPPGLTVKVAPADVSDGQLAAYAAEFPMRDVPDSVEDHEAWSEYIDSLPPSEPKAVAEVAVEYSSWTSHRRNAVEGFRAAARMLWSLRAEGLALPGSDEYRMMRGSMRTFRALIATCDRQNDALRREIAATN